MKNTRKLIISKKKLGYIYHLELSFDKVSSFEQKFRKLFSGEVRSLNDFKKKIPVICYFEKSEIDSFISFLKEFCKEHDLEYETFSKND